VGTNEEHLVKERSISSVLLCSGSITEQAHERCNGGWDELREEDEKIVKEKMWSEWEKVRKEITSFKKNLKCFKFLATIMIVR
jgi:hypothetical protein